MSPTPKDTANLKLSKQSLILYYIVDDLKGDLIICFNTDTAPDSNLVEEVAKERDKN